MNKWVIRIINVIVGSAVLFISGAAFIAAGLFMVDALGRLLGLWQ